MAYFTHFTQRQWNETDNIYIWIHHGLLCLITVIVLRGLWMLRTTTQASLKYLWNEGWRFGWVYGILEGCCLWFCELMGFLLLRFNDTQSLIWHWQRLIPDADRLCPSHSVSSMCEWSLTAKGLLHPASRTDTKPETSSDLSEVITDTRCSRPCITCQQADYITASTWPKRWTVVGWWWCWLSGVVCRAWKSGPINTVQCLGEWGGDGLAHCGLSFSREAQNPLDCWSGVRGCESCFHMWVETYPFTHTPDNMASSTGGN